MCVTYEGEGLKKYEVFVMSAEKESHFILILVFHFKQSN